MAAVRGVSPDNGSAATVAPTGWRDPQRPQNTSRSSTGLPQWLQKGMP
jgi:hypothetical protein